MSKRKLFKYELEGRNPSHIHADVPKGGQIIKVALQQGANESAGICLWVIVNPEAELERLHFMVAATGEDVPSNVWHVATILQDNYVWHIFQGNWEDFDEENKPT